MAVYLIVEHKSWTRLSSKSTEIKLGQWARTTSDYSKAFTRIRDAVAALPVESAVIDGGAIILRPDNTSDFEPLRSGAVRGDPGRL